ncbi:MAG: DUF5667 domain-containing protein [Nanoarchaeota archaeon]
MRKYFVFVCFLLLLPMALAQEAVSEDPGITPDSFLWGVDRALEQVSLLLAADPEAKVVKGLEIARERLLEVKAMAEEKNLPALEKAQGEHSKALLKVKDNVKRLEEDDPEEQLEKELVIEKELREHQKEIEEVSARLKVKIKIEGVLSAEQQARLDEFLASLGESAEEVEVEIKSKRDETKIKIKDKTGKSEEEIDEEIEDLEDELGLGEERLKVRAEVIDGKTLVKVNLKFDSLTTDKQALLAEIVERFSLDTETAASLLKIEDTEDTEDAEDTEEMLRVKVKTDVSLSEVDVKLRFAVNSTEEDAIVAALVSKTQLTAEQIEAVWQLKDEKLKEEKEIEIEVEIEEGEAQVKVETDGSKMEFTLQETDREKIVQEIASRLGISVEEVLKYATFEEDAESEKSETEDAEEDLKDEDTEDDEGGDN